jgi:hypothetical protein
MQGLVRPQGPSDVYEVKLATTSATAQSHTLTLSNLPAGTYAILGNAALIPLERKTGAVRCELTADDDCDLAVLNFTSPRFGFEAATLSTQLTHTFTTTGAVLMRCGFEIAVPTVRSTDPAARIVAIRVDGAHVSTAEAG